MLSFNANFDRKINLEFGKIIIYFSYFKYIVIRFIFKLFILTFV